jgi:hypothetical protein
VNALRYQPARVPKLRRHSVAEDEIGTGVHERSKPDRARWGLRLTNGGQGRSAAVGRPPCQVSPTPGFSGLRTGRPTKRSGRIVCTNFPLARQRVAQHFK